MDKVPSNNNENSCNGAKDDKSQPTIHPPKKNDKIANCNHNNSNEKTKISWPSKLTAVCTLAIVFITGYYACYAKKQAIYMEEAVNIASDTAKRQLRAYIHADIAKITNIAKPLRSDMGRKYKPTEADFTVRRSGPFIHVFFKNSGQTPAYKMVCSIEPIILDFPLRVTVPVKPPKQTPTIIGRDAVRIVNVGFPKPLTNKQITALRKSTKAIYIIGEVTYSDIFMTIHHMQFKLAHNAEITGPIGISIDCAIIEEDGD